jgi:hypothetical protein
MIVIFDNSWEMNPLVSFSQVITEICTGILLPFYSYFTGDEVRISLEGLEKWKTAEVNK